METLTEKFLVIGKEAAHVAKEDLADHLEKKKRGTPPEQCSTMGAYPFHRRSA